jgi:hypothetical protein
MTVRELHKDFTYLIATGKGDYEVEALVDTPETFNDGEVLSVAVHDTKPVVVVHVEVKEGEK